MPSEPWVMDRSDIWRTCYCIHVRTAASVVGVIQLIIYILEISCVIANLMYLPDNNGMVMNPNNRQLDTPRVMVNKPSFDPTIQFGDPQQQYGGRDAELMAAIPSSKSVDFAPGIGSDYRVRKPNILLEMCQMLITLLMIYGAVRGKPSYLMPFFVVRVFDFCYFCLKMMGLFSELPSVNELLIKLNTQLPQWQPELNRMDPQLLLLITLIVTVCCIAYKAYVVGVTWSCYKYLMLRNTVIRGVIALRQDDPTHVLSTQQNLLPDLPDYETAVSDPRYAKKPPLTHYHEVNEPGSHEVDAGNPQQSEERGSNSSRMPPPPPYSRVARETSEGSTTASQSESNDMVETREEPQPQLVEQPSSSRVESEDSK